MWSQMHGNETTTTKALIDCFNLFESNNEFSNTILNSCTLYIIPILNPDGAEKYTRFNSNSVDLNRDAQNLSQAESKVLNKVFVFCIPGKIVKSGRLPSTIFSCTKVTSKL